MAQVVVFWQPGFPTVASQPVDRATLSAALDPGFLDLKALAGSWRAGQVRAVGASLRLFRTHRCVEGDRSVSAARRESSRSRRPAIARTGHPGGRNFCSGPSAGYLLAGAGFAPHLRGPRGARCSFCVEAGLRLCDQSQAAGREILHRRGSSQRAWLHGRHHRTAGSSTGHRDRPRTRQPHRLPRLSAGSRLLGEPGWHRPHSPVCRLCAPGFHAPLGRNAFLCPQAERAASDHRASAASAPRKGRCTRGALIRG